MKRVRHVVKAARRNNAEALIDLSCRRSWYDGEDDTTKLEEETPVPDTNADTGKPTGEEDETVQIKQSRMTELFTEARGQAKRNAISDLLKDLDVSDVTALKSIAESHKQAEDEKAAAKEAQKTELEKKQTELAASITLQETMARTNADLLIRLAVIERAPAKEVQAALFGDLLTLLNKSSIEIKDGVVDVATVDAAIDATLEGRDYLKVQASNGQGYGSPNRKSPPKAKAPLTPGPVEKRQGRGI